MKYFFSLLLILFLSLQLIAAEEPEQNGNPDTIDVFLILKQLHKNEEVLSTLKTSRDANLTPESQEYSQTLNTYAEKKNRLLNKALVSARTGVIAAAFDTNEYNDQKRQLSHKITANTKLGYELAVLRDEVRMMHLDLEFRIHQFVKNIKRDIQKSVPPEQLEKDIRNELKWLEQAALTRYYEAVQKNVHNRIADELSSNLNEVESLSISYRELLTFFLEETPLLLSEDLIIKMFKIDTFTETLDSWVQINIRGIGFGKLVLMGLILLFFFSIRKLISRVMIIIVNRFLLRDDADAKVHAHFVQAIQGPVNYFLIAYSLGLVFEVYYYPLVVSETFEQWLGVIYVLILAWVVIKLVSVYGEHSIANIVKSNDHLRKEVINVLMKLGYFAIVVVAVFWIFQLLDYNVSAIIASLGIGGLAVALAAKDTLSNFFASVMILMDNSFSQGDWIECDGIEGTVVEIGLRKTTIRTFDNALLFVPNARLAENSIRNWNRRKVGRRIKMHVGVTYDSPPEKIRACVEDIRKMLLEHPGITNPDEEEAYFSKTHMYSFRNEIVSFNDLQGYKRTFMVYLDQLNSSSIDILIYCFSRTTSWEEWLKVKEDVIYKIMDIVQGHGLSFAFPSQSIYVESFPDTVKKEQT